MYVCLHVCHIGTRAYQLAVSRPLPFHCHVVNMTSSESLEGWSRAATAQKHKQRDSVNDEEWRERRTVRVQFCVSQVSETSTLQTSIGARHSSASLLLWMMLQLQLSWQWCAGSSWCKHCVNSGDINRLSSTLEGGGGVRGSMLPTPLWGCENVNLSSCFPGLTQDCFHLSGYDSTPFRSAHVKILLLFSRLKY